MHLLLALGREDLFAVAAGRPRFDGVVLPRRPDPDPLAAGEINPQQLVRRPHQDRIADGQRLQDGNRCTAFVPVLFSKLLDQLLVGPVDARRNPPAVAQQRQTALSAAVALRIAAMQHPLSQFRRRQRLTLPDQSVEPGQRLGFVPEQGDGLAPQLDRIPARSCAQGDQGLARLLGHFGVQPARCQQERQFGLEPGGCRGRSGHAFEVQGRRGRPPARQLVAPRQNRRLVTRSRVHEATDDVGQLVHVAFGQCFVQLCAGLSPELQLVRLASLGRQSGQHLLDAALQAELARRLLRVRLDQEIVLRFSQFRVLDHQQAAQFVGRIGETSLGDRPFRPHQRLAHVARRRLEDARRLVVLHLSHLSHAHLGHARACGPYAADSNHDQDHPSTPSAYPMPKNARKMHRFTAPDQTEKGARPRGERKANTPL